MGLFDGIKLMGDIVKAGVAAFKSSEKLEALTDRSRTECGGFHPEQEKLYQECRALRAAREKEEDTEKANALTEQIEAAEVKYLASLEEDTSIDKAFRAEITLALQEYARTNSEDGVMDDILGKYLMKQAKTDEEKEGVRLMMEGGKASMKLDRLASRSQDEFRSLVKPEQAKLYQDYKAISDAREKEKNTDRKNAMANDVDNAQEKYLSAVAADAAFPQDFRDEIASALAEYKRINGAIQALS